MCAEHSEGVLSIAAGKARRQEAKVEEKVSTEQSEMHIARKQVMLMLPYTVFVVNTYWYKKGYRKC